MSAAVVALLVAISSSVWVFTKLQNKTGYGNNQNAIIGAAVFFVIAFIVIFTTGHSFLH